MLGSSSDGIVYRTRFLGHWARCFAQSGTRRNVGSSTAMSTPGPMAVPQLPRRRATVRPPRRVARSGRVATGVRGVRRGAGRAMARRGGGRRDGGIRISARDDITVRPGRWVRESAPGRSGYRIGDGPSDLVDPFGYERVLPRIQSCHTSRRDAAYDDSDRGAPIVDDNLQAELERLRAENARLKRDRGRTVSLKVSAKGGCRCMASVAFPSRSIRSSGSRCWP